MYVNGVNLYQFEGSDPIDLVDPTGEAIVSYFVAAASGDNDQVMIPNSVGSTELVIESDLDEAALQWVVQRAAEALKARLQESGGNAQDFIDQLPAEVNKWKDAVDPNAKVKVHNKADLGKSKGNSGKQSSAQNPQNPQNPAPATGGGSAAKGENPTPEPQETAPPAQETIPDRSLPDLDPKSGRLHGDLPNPSQLTEKQAQQQLDKVEQSIDMREWNNDEPLDEGHQQRLEQEQQYMQALQKRLGQQ
jgi:hypothetical protein